ncbi:Phosphoribosylformylglycinamidine synthase, synthetase subunit / Phosphoribosylformylglycinamidine synthase, glutamine amidotransferase subunit [Thioalkalivibrio nitratireducens DSM 14787]|uniref:Phosphoribosylformylglycinamidine synthase n=1 Tax=Thioalkalivibrio nitratireducens (strain DSM 14787 / UNIQEM 213 / ALEN2) TaxID=1255043 RepID=L0DWS3_THIND|nr:phosphoribosylformylglycinamidine synthase [Thioalkalivibrio nitratireducens]AGA33493.1 Phosphoribosylformylglycinamidine synthase, synthetase subunit / Phosphoribosylformylglycinamidine synthase, glutamine amidotransferase subunit [Thioalkalivibrio nitratireducens DSM 14787]
MRVFEGGSAFSPFRIRQREALMDALQPGAWQLAARFVYFVETRRQLASAETAQLEDLLLGEGEPWAGAGFDAVRSLFVVPRLGTISPWSSKATEIALHAGMEDAIGRIERGIHWFIGGDAAADLAVDALGAPLHDRMTETVVADAAAAAALFSEEGPRPLRSIDLGADPQAALQAANRELGLALSDDETAYLARAYAEMGRAPTDAELMMFAQANSEHCRHKIFNAAWTLDGEAQEQTLFGMIRHTYNESPGGVLSAYCDNASVIEGHRGVRLMPDHVSGEYRRQEVDLPILMKVETHNHPTAISPFPGAATGSGGEIRDEGATGRGSRPKAGLTGFSVSNLRIPGFEQPWEADHGRPGRIESALGIMIEGPIGAAAFNNEFGRPAVAGYFRTLETEAGEGRLRRLFGYHKPIMIAGGMGSLRREHVHKQGLPAGTPVVVLGGPAMLIGLGGGAASSVASGASAEQLDFASVQRGNPEMERRCQEVIDRCTAMGPENPILSIHDVGAGGLSNAIPEILDDAGRGGHIELREVPSAEPGLSPLEIWCNEAQERYVLAIAPERLPAFRTIAERERAPVAVVGEATEAAHLRVDDRLLGVPTVDLPMAVLLGRTPRMHRSDRRLPGRGSPFDPGALDLDRALARVLRLPAVAAKHFLITIGDRSVGGLTARDQMVGPWQVPVADCAVTLTDFEGFTGEAMAMGERTPLAILSAPASGRMAVGEVITNLAAADITDTAEMRLSANWMAAAGVPGEDAALFDTVRAVGEELCPRLGISIPVGKDSLSMRTVWEQHGKPREMLAPVSLIVSGFAPVRDVRRTLTPVPDAASDGPLWLIDLGEGNARLGGSALAQVQGEVGDVPPDLVSPERLRGFVSAIRRLQREGRITAYHDRSDGGLIVTLLEMAFAGRCGLEVQVPEGVEPIGWLFNEELGAVVQLAPGAESAVREAFDAVSLATHLHAVAEPDPDGRVRVRQGVGTLLDSDRATLQRQWQETSFEMQRLRDAPDCADEELARVDRDGGLKAALAFDPAEDVAAPFIATGARPRVAILREQGVNGQLEMAAAFHRAGFTPVDVHMTDLLAGRHDLAQFKGLAACGGFSYGDVLGAGGGWAKTILFHDALQNRFQAFFERSDSFALGVCNGCQMFSHLAPLIPGAEHWPRFVRNRSEQFEARLSLVEVPENPSVLLAGMAGSVLPVVVSHGEGRARFAKGGDLQRLVETRQVALRYVEADGPPAERYPANPNGSPDGVTGFTSADGRVTIMMPHPERVFRTVQHSWHPANWGEDGPWLRMFRNARAWVG